jgi:uncharacterized protein YndB with AHSA1/START domain
MADYSTSIDIDAPAEVVFGHLTSAEGMTAWMGQHAELDPVPGGEFAVDINGTPIRGRYVEVVPPRRLVVTWGVAGNEDFPGGSSRVEFTLPSSPATAWSSRCPPPRLPQWSPQARRFRSSPVAGRRGSG